MSLRLEPVWVASRSDDTEGRLVFAGGCLVAVLVRLSDMHDADAGRWFLEAGFAWLEGRRQPVFADLDEAQAWIADRLAQEP